MRRGFKPPAETNACYIDRAVKYDPDEQLATDAWNRLNDDEKRAAVEEYHRRRRIRMPNARVHAMFHVIVENQVAMREGSEGLSRHDAVHAIGSVVAGQIFHRLKDPGGNQDLTPEYTEKLKRLTAESWRQQFQK